MGNLLYRHSQLSHTCVRGEITEGNLQEKSTTRNMAKLYRCFIGHYQLIPGNCIYPKCGFVVVEIDVLEVAHQNECMDCGEIVWVSEFYSA